MSQKDSVVREKQQHILVCLSSSPSNKRIIDEAANLANAFHAEFTALYVSNVRENSLNEVDRVRLQNNIRYAEDKGAEITTVIGENISFQIAEFARISGVTKIVIGRSNTKKFHFWDKQTLTEQLIMIAPHVDIYIIPDSKMDIKENRKIRLTEYMRPTKKDILITITLLFSTAMVANAQFREKVIAWVVETFEKYSIFELQSDGENTQPDLQSYKPAYLPDRAELQNTVELPEFIIYKYKIGNSDYFNIQLSQSDTRTYVDTESADIETLDMNGVTGYFFKKDGLNYVCFERDGAFFSVYGSLDVDELIKIAAGITKE